MNEKELYVWKHKTEKSVYLVRNRSCCGGSIAEDFFSLTEDFDQALRNSLACNDMEYEQYIKIPYSFRSDVDDTMPFTKKMNVEIDGYKGILTKTVRYSLKDFEKIVLWRPERGEDGEM